MALCLRLVSMFQAGITNLSLQAVNSHQQTELPMPALIWNPSRIESDCYNVLWKCANVNGDTSLSRLEAFSFLLQSGIDRIQITEILQLTNGDDVTVTFESFVTALR